jgi:membrane protease YdiL (CAAX protease family)
VIVIVPWVLVIGIGIFLLGKLRFSDLGIFRAKILPAILFGFGYWLTLQVIISLAVFLLEGRLAWEKVIPGYLFDQLLFFALAEEIIFRGYLFPQVFLKFNRSSKNPGRAFWGALLVSQTIFSLSHIPHRLVNNTPLQDIPYQLVFLFISGLFLCYIYLRSLNLLVAVAVHAIGNAPTVLFSYDVLPWYVVNLLGMVSAIILIEIWQRQLPPKQGAG